MFGVLCKMAFPSKDDELGPGIDFDLVSLLLSPAGAAIGKYEHLYLILKSNTITQLLYGRGNFSFCLC